MAIWLAAATTFAIASSPCAGGPPGAGAGGAWSVAPCEPLLRSASAACWRSRLAMRARTVARRDWAPRRRASCDACLRSSALRRTFACERSSLACLASLMSLSRSWARSFVCDATARRAPAGVAEDRRVAVRDVAQEPQLGQQVVEALRLDGDAEEVGRRRLVRGDEVRGQGLLVLRRVALEAREAHAGGDEPVLRVLRLLLATLDAGVEHREAVLGVGDPLGRRGDLAALRPDGGPELCRASPPAPRSSARSRCRPSAGRPRRRRRRAATRRLRASGGTRRRS